MSNKIKGVKIRDGQGNLSDEIPIGALAQNIDYDIQADTNVKQKIDAIETRLQNIDLTSVVYKGSGVNSVIVNVVGKNPNLSNTASGDYSCAEGYYTKALGANSHAEGSYSTAREPNSHAEGYQTYASGSSSHTEGNQTQASGGASHAEGQNTIAIGVGSHAEGNATRASGINSHAEGQGTVAQSNNQTVFGKYNKIDSASNYIEIAGNGTGVTNDTRSNARTLDWDGNEWIAGSIKVGGTGYSDSNAKTIATVDQVQGLVDRAIQNSEEIKGLVNNAVSEITPANLSLDADLQAQNKAAPAATVGNRLNEKIDKPNGVNQGLVPISDGQGGVTWGEVSQDLNGYVQKPKNNNQPINGNNGQILKTNGDGTTSWINNITIDASLTNSNQAADAKAVKDELDTKLKKPSNNGNNGQILKTNGNGTTSWINQPDLSRYVQTDDLNGYVQIPTEDRRSGSVLISNNDNSAIIWSDNLIDVQNNLIRIPKDANDIATNGTSGQLLKTNGDGTTTWIDLLKTLYNLEGRKFLFVGDSYCQGYSNTSADCNRGWAYYCAEKLGLKRTQTFSANNQIDDKYVRPVKDWNKDKKIYEMHDGQPHTYTYQKTENGTTTDVTETYSLPTRIINQTENNDYEIICNGGAKFAEASSGTTFDELIIDAKRKYPNQVFTDIVVCGGYNERKNTATEIINGIRNFITQVQELYSNANIYIGYIGYNKKGNGNNAPENSTSSPEKYRQIRERIEKICIPAYKSCIFENRKPVYLNNVEYIIENSDLSDDDGYHPNDKGNQKLGAAIAMALIYNSASFSYNEETLQRLQRRRKILILGDKYCQGWSANQMNTITGSQSASKNPGWYTYFQKYLNIFETSTNRSVYPVQSRNSNAEENQITTVTSRIDYNALDDYKVTCYNGARFQGKNHDWKFMTFEELLDDAYNNKFNIDFTDIIVCGGIADATMFVAADYDSEDKKLNIKNNLKSSIRAFIAKAKKYYPNVRIYIGCIGKDAVKAANSSEAEKGSATRDFMEEGGLVLQSYRSCEEYGAKYIYNIENCFAYEDVLPPPGTADKWRRQIAIPKDKIELIAKTIADFIKQY